jgi:predicted nucleic acid-binding protein
VCENYEIISSLSQRGERREQITVTDHAAVAKAKRMGRLSQSELLVAIDQLDLLLTEVDLIEVTAEVARSAGGFAQRYDLRGYDAVHLAAAASELSNDFTLVTGDQDLAYSALSLGISVSRHKNRTHLGGGIASQLLHYLKDRNEEVSKNCCKYWISRRFAFRRIYFSSYAS